MPDVELRIVIQGDDRSQAAAASAKAGLTQIGNAATATGAKVTAAGNSGFAALDRLSASAKRAQASMAGLQTAASAAVSAGVGLAALGAGLTAVAALPIATAAGFERAMDGVLAVTVQTEAQFESLSRTARDLGATTKFSAIEAADGMKFLALAGLDANEIAQAIGPALNLAAAGGLGLAEAADIASNVMAGFRLEAADVERITDVMATTAASANTSVRQLGEAMSFVAPIAAASGISLEEAAAAMGVLGNAGIQASRAGTGLRGIIAALEAPTKRGQRALSDLNVEVIRDEKGMINLTETMAALSDAGINTAQAFDLFRRVAAPAALAIAANTEELVELNEANEEITRTAAEMAKIMEENLIGSITILRSALKELNISLAQNLIPALDAVVKAVSFVVTEIAKWADRFPTLSAVLIGFVGTLGILTLALAAVLIPLGLIGGGILNLINLLPVLQNLLATNTTALTLFRGGLLTAKIAILAFIASLTINKLLELKEVLEDIVAVQQEQTARQQERLDAAAAAKAQLTAEVVAEEKVLKARFEAGKASDEEIKRLREITKIRFQYVSGIANATTELNQGKQAVEFWNKAQQDTLDLLKATAPAQDAVNQAIRDSVPNAEEARDAIEKLRAQIGTLESEYNAARSRANQFGNQAAAAATNVAERTARLGTITARFAQQSEDPVRAWNALRSEAIKLEAAASKALVSGDLQLATKLADEAAQKYSSLVGEVKKGDRVFKTQATTIESATRGVRSANLLAIKAQEAQGKAAEENRIKQEQEADKIQDKIKEFRDLLAEIEPTKDVKVTADTTDAEQNVDELIGKMDDLAKKILEARDAGIQLDKTLAEIETEAGIAPPTGRFGGLVQNARRIAAQTGGRLTGFGGGDRIKAMLEPGEWVIRKEAVKKYGNAFMAMVNSMKLPRVKVPELSFGGLQMKMPRVPVPAFQAGGAAAAAATGRTVNLNLNLGGGETFQLQGEQRVVEGLVRRLRREARVTVG